MNDSFLPYSRQALRNGVHLSRQFVIVAAHGCGKTTLADAIAASFEPRLKRISGGALMRCRAAELGMSIEDFAARMKAHPEEGHDQWCDDLMASFSNQNDIVVDAHLPVFFPYGFLVLLVCSPHEAAKRRAGPDADASQVSKTASDIEKRKPDDESKYARIYPGSLWLETDYDIMINTETHGPEACLKIVMTEHASWLGRDRQQLITSKVMPMNVLVAS